MSGLLKLVRFGCLVFLLAAAVFMWWVSNVFSPVTKKSQLVLIQIKEGMTGAEVAEMLEEKHLIRSAFAMRMAMKLSESELSVKKGEYQVDPSKSPLVILKELNVAQPLSRRATFPEGVTLKQVAEILGKAGVTDPKEFEKLTSQRGKTIDKDLPNNLEGYLYPDTYEFAWEPTPTEVAKQMTGQFRKVTDPMWRNYKKKAPLNFRDTVILASLVEREAQVPSERPLIAGVYINRLKKGMRLECDATVQYALGEQKKYLTYADLEIKSPYNTYKHEGLPPGPIANPGKSSLEAAMRPEPSNYIYYVRNDVKNDGSHIFSRTYEEHNDAIRQYQR